jgi:hypothetical protein
MRVRARPHHSLGCFLYTDCMYRDDGAGGASSAEATLCNLDWNLHLVSQ